MASTTLLDKPKTVPTRGDRVIRFIEQHCVHPDGAWVGRPVRLLDWQKQFLRDLFAIDPSTGLRRVRWCLLGVPKKNGKTSLAAWVALYLLLADGEPAPLVVCAASSEDQADLVFGAARRVCELSPTLRRVTERFEREILVPSSPGARLRRVAAVAGTNDGQNIHAVICDELHEWTGHKGRQVWNVLTNGTGARRQPLVLQITTAGWDTETVCYEQYEYGRRVLNGEIDDQHYLFRWYAAPDYMDYRDPEAWRIANPSYGVTVHEDFFRDQLTKKSEATFRRYFLNQWVSSEEVWLPPGAWDACRVDPWSWDPDAPVWIGLDTSVRHDATALVVGQWMGGRLHVRARIWEPALLPSGEPDPEWRIPEEEIEAEIRRLCRELRVQRVLSDWAHMRLLAQRLLDDGIPVEEVPPTASRMVPATQVTTELVLQRRLAHDGDPALARHVANAAVKHLPDGGIRLTKGRSRRPMDGAIALALVCLAASRPSAERSPTTNAPNLWLPDDLLGEEGRFDA